MSKQKSYDLKVGEPFNPVEIFGGVCIRYFILSYSGITDQEKLLFGILFENAEEDIKATIISREELCSTLSWNIKKLNKNINSLKNKKLIGIREESKDNITFEFYDHELYPIYNVIEEN
jgi:hypothetical protein